ncbi:TonB-dependent receptor plug domain-containing protein, partial [Rheinheimera sp.]|uniref:TonB-dependent receptor plug domain-containing protein n=1 Tax=Rheinheimera sp. TaxID=1869214 RepID=UPI00307F14D6
MSALTRLPRTGPAPFRLNRITLGCLLLAATSATPVLADVAAEAVEAAVAEAGEATRPNARAKEKAVERISVVASPIRNSQEQSIALQREATNVVNVIASDDIGRFPDQTAAAALARLPAVAVQRDQGQERYIQMRGAPARWTVVAFDGVNVLGAEERVFRFDSVPANLMSEVVVAKTLTPQMPSEAVAGRVDIKTFSPLTKPGFAADLDLGLGKNQLGDGDQERYAGRLSWSDGTYGVMVAGSTYSNEQTTDNNETSWDANGAPTGFDVRSYKITRETNSGAVKFEFAPTDNDYLSLSSLYTEFLDHELRNQFTFDLDAASVSGTRGVSSGDLVAVPVTAMYQDGDYANSTWVNTLAGEHERGDWLWNWSVNYTETESTVNLPIIRRMQTNPSQFASMHYDMSNPAVPQMQLYNTVVNADRSMSRGSAVSALNQSGFGFDGVIIYDMENTTEALGLKLDGAYSFQHADADAKLEFGVQLDQRDAQSPGSAQPFIYVGPLAQAAGLDFDLNQFNTSTPWDTDMGHGFSVNYFDNAGARQLLDQTLASLTDMGLVNPDTFRSADSAYEVQEDIQSAYAMNTWTWDQHQVLMGVRAERVSLDSAGFVKTATATEALQMSRDDTKLFPSIHWNMDITEDLKFRLAGVTGSSRASFSQVRAGASISDTDQSISGGNPYLKDEEAVGVDSYMDTSFLPSVLSVHLSSF